MKALLSVIIGLSLLIPIAAAAAVLPMNGAVTIIAENGVFYTNLGATNQLVPGAKIGIFRNCQLIARATVFKVNYLDSLAVLDADSCRVIPESGDEVVVEYAPVVNCANGCVTYPPGVIPVRDIDGTRVGMTSKLCGYDQCMPWWEINQFDYSAEDFFGLAAGILIAVTLTNTHF